MLHPLYVQSVSEVPVPTKKKKKMITMSLMYLSKKEEKLK